MSEITTYFATLKVPAVEGPEVDLIRNRWNWIEGKQYNAWDDGHTMGIQCEGDMIHALEDYREALLSMFDLVPRKAVPKEPRTLYDIVEAAKDNEPTTHEELLYALLVYANLFAIEHRQLRGELNREPRMSGTSRMRIANNSFDSYKKALSLPPKDFLGWSSDPKNPAYQKFRAAGNKLFDKVLGEDKADG